MLNELNIKNNQLYNNEEKMKLLVNELLNVTQELERKLNYIDQ